MTTATKRKLGRPRVTHCKRGHELAGENELIYWAGKYKVRQCRACQFLRRKNKLIEEEAKEA